MTNEALPPKAVSAATGSPAGKKRGRPPRVATTPQESTVAESKSNSGTQIPAEPEIATQRLEVLMARHMIQDHRMTWGEARSSLGYGAAGRDAQMDERWDAVYKLAQR